MSGPKTCSGCGKPFSGLRKPRLHGAHAFISTVPESAGRTGLVSLAFCGCCRDEIQANNGRAWSLPRMEQQAQHLEALTLADTTCAAH